MTAAASKITKIKTKTPFGGGGLTFEDRLVHRQGHPVAVFFGFLAVLGSELPPVALPREQLPRDRRGLHPVLLEPLQAHPEEGGREEEDRKHPENTVEE